MNRYDVWLDGINIRDCDPRIIVGEITEAAPKEKVYVTVMGYTHGSRLSRTTRQSLSVSVDIGIKETDMRERDAVYQSIRKWGRGSAYLTTSAREAQRLYVEEMGIKTRGEKWTETITLTFTAYAKPFWENVGARSASVSAATSGSTTLSALGNADECTVDAEITAVGGTLNTLTVAVGDTEMAFTGLGIAEGEKLTIAHTEAGFLTIKNGSTSLMDKRTGDDDLIAEPGSGNTVSFIADVTCTAKFSARGRWL